MEPTTPDAVSDKAIAYIKTAIPAAWGAALVWLATAWPGMPEFIETFLASEPVLVVLTATATLAWYAFWRKVQPRLPAWVTRIALGSVKLPSYGNQG